MIFRAGAFFLLLYALGFALFGVTLGQPAGAERTDSVVVLTGGSGRIERGLDVMRDGLAKRMLVSGVDPSVTRGDLQRRLGRDSARLLRCCVDLGSESVDTRSNAEEAERWLKRRGDRSVRLVTSNYHMRRAEFLFRERLGSDFRIVPDAVVSKPSFALLFEEYNGYLLTRLAVLVDM